MSVIRDMLSSFAGFFARVGALTRFFLRLLWLTPSGFLRPRLVVEQVYNAGALSLVIIMTSGLFVGMVMGLPLALAGKASCAMPVTASG